MRASRSVFSFFGPTWFVPNISVPSTKVLQDASRVSDIPPLQPLKSQSCCAQWMCQARNLLAKVNWELSPENSNKNPAYPR